MLDCELSDAMKDMTRIRNEAEEKIKYALMIPSKYFGKEKQKQLINNNT